jgi:prephenate dehydratase
MRNIGYLGPEGTYTHRAAEIFSSSLSKIPYSTINEVIRSLENNNSENIIVPVENSIHGSIGEVLDFLAKKNNFKIIKELELEINHSIYKLNAPSEVIEVIFSHPQALGQCYEYISSNYPNAELRHSNSTASSLNDLINYGPKGAFIGPPWMENEPQVLLIDKYIQSSKNNVTRFVVISGNSLENENSNYNKTSIVVSFNDDSPGSLLKVIEPFAEKGINMTKIESRPTKEKLGNYYFFIDIEGHVNEDKIQLSLNEIRENVSVLKILGSYPRIVRN